MIIEMFKKFMAEFMIKIMLLGYLFFMFFVAYIFGINNMNILLSLLVSTLLYSPILIFSSLKYRKFYRKINVKNEAQYQRDVEVEYNKIVKNENN